MMLARSTTTPIQRRLAPLLASAFAGGIALWVPVEKLFMNEIGFTPVTMGVMAASYAAVVPLLEVPSGILADRWSRRGVLVVGNLGAFASVLIGGLSTSVTTYIVAALLLGVYFAMQSGTVDSIVYDTVLEETGSSDSFENVLGRLRVVSSVALVSGAVAGGALASATSPRVTYFATLPLLAASTAALFAFREPKLHQQDQATSLRRHLARTLAVVRSQPRLIPIAALLIVTSLLTQAIFEFGPLWLLAVGTDPGLYGIAWALLMASLGLGGVLAGRMRLDARGPRIVLVGLLAVASTTLLVSHHAIVVTIAQVALATFAVAVGVLATRLLHDRIPSTVRSSVSSGIGAATWITFLPFALVFGLVSEQFSVHAAGWMLIAATVATIALLLTVSRGIAADSDSITHDSVARFDGVAPEVGARLAAAGKAA